VVRPMPTAFNLYPNRLRMNLDKTDLRILKILQQNGRITNLELSQTIGLSPAPTLERVKKLEKNGFIKSYHARVDETKLGIGIKAMMLITLPRHTEGVVDKFKRQIAEIDEITDCFKVTGNADYILHVMVKDIHAFEELVARKIATIEEISQMQTMVILSKAKESSVIPYNYEY
jgi:Lrp/AsnC family leucine-responsive transcriptional regulator